MQRLLPYALLAVCALLCSAPVAEARGSGIDFWLLDSNGKQIRKLDGSNGDLIDARGERIYRAWKGKLSAFSFHKKEPLWTVACDLEQRPTQRAFLSGPVLVLLTPSVLLGVDTATGKMLYQRSVKGLELVAPYTTMWRYLQDVGDSLYLVEHKQRNVHKSDGRWLGSEATAPPVLIRHDLRTGRVRWRAKVVFREPKDLVKAVVRGLAIGWNGYLAFFDPETGAAKQGTVTRSADYFIDGHKAWLLSREAPPRLLAWNGASGSWRWAMPWRAGKFRLLGVDGRHLWVAGADHLFAVDEAKRRVVTRLAVAKNRGATPDVRVFGAGAHSLVEEPSPTADPTGRRDGRRVKALAPGAAHTLWKHDAAAVGFASPRRLVLIAPGRYLGFYPWSDDDERTPAVVSVSPSDGSERWRWPVPAPPGGYCDDAVIHVQRCPSGFFVTRSWSVLD